jgi:hypothetical protein
MSRLAERLSAARSRRVVGRTGEQTLFQSALTSADRPFLLLYIYGPGGIGKTTLLNSFVRLCEEAHVPSALIDARNVDASPEAFLDALRMVLNIPSSQSPLPALANHVLLLDTCEILTPLEYWLRENFLPELPDSTLVVMAGRQPLSPAWRTDPGWQALVRSLPIRNLSPDESRAYLVQRGVPEDQHDAVLGFTHGHPLALSLVAEVFNQRPGLKFQPEDTPDVVKTLLEQFVQKVPGPAHRAALEACSLVRVLTEDLLAEMLANPDAHELFEWLRGLSFIQSGPGGVFPHDLAREALSADVRWRNPNWYGELHRRARTHYVDRLQRASGVIQQQIMFDYIFLHRDNPAVRPFFEWQTSGVALTDKFRESDRDELLAMIAQHEGDESARLAALWLDRQPQNMMVMRDATGKLAGCLFMLALHAARPADVEADPGARAAWRYLHQHAPLRPGEVATLFRFWMARDTYQAVSPIQSLAFINCVLHYLTTPGLAFIFFPCADPDFWVPVFAYADLNRLTEADFEVGGRWYGMYGHDWRAVPPVAWLNLLAERETAMGAAAAPQARPPDPLIVLSETEFAEALHQALKDFTMAEVLRGSPLLRSRLVMERAGPGSDEASRAATLQALIKEAAETLLASPREAKLYRALEVTYFKPAPTQEQAAEQLDLPFSTFRRHLKVGQNRVIELLWQREIGGAVG